MLRTILFLVLSLMLSAYQAAANDMFEIEVNVHYDADDAEHLGTGMILIEEGGFANVNVVIFENGSLRLSTAQSSTRLKAFTDRQGKVTVYDEEEGMIDLVLSPRERKHGDIRVSGQIEILTRIAGSSRPSHEFQTEAISFVVDDGEPFKFGSPMGKGAVDVEVTIRKQPYMHPNGVQDDRGRPALLFETEYSLYNNDDSDYEVKAYKCLLGSEGDYSEGEKHCEWYAYYPIEDDDSLLYWFSYNIDDVDWIGGDEFEVTIDFSRTYAINPDEFDPDADMATFNNATISLFSKEVRTQVGEVLDIILDDRPDRLPFRGRETIRLISRTGK